MISVEVSAAAGRYPTHAGSRPVFIVGCPRSGTTWLYHILLSAGRFAIYRSETHIYNSFAPCYGNFSHSGRRAAFLRKWLRSEYFLRSGLDAESFYVKAMDRGDSPGRMLRLLMEEICAYQHASRWAECTPEYSLCVQRIKRDFPEALFIHIVRDGRDVALSLARQGFVKPFPWHTRQSEVAAAAYWHWILDSVARQSRAFAADVLTVRYEDLVTDYRRSLNEISAFIGQPIDVTRVAASQIGAVAKPNSSFAAPVGASSGPSVGRWQAEISAAVLETIERMLDIELTGNGYALHTDGTHGSRGATLQRDLYSARFAAMWTLKTRTWLGRFASDGLTRLSADAQADDLTLRPGRHLDAIRRIVEG